MSRLLLAVVAVAVSSPLTLADDARNSISNIDTIPDMVKTYMSMINRDTLTRSIFEIV